MAYENFNKRNKLTYVINSDKISGDLVNFPVLISIGENTAENEVDTRLVINNLILMQNSYLQRKKLAFTVVDSLGQETELYAEIDYWNHDTREAKIWVKVPLISATHNTIINLYYDLFADDNTEYIGDIGEAAGQQVWTGGHQGVYHLSEAVDNVGDFNYLINPTLWQTPSPTGLNVDAEDITLAQNLYEVYCRNGVSVSTYHIHSNYVLEGDFDIQVSAEITNNTATNRLAVGFGVVGDNCDSKLVGIRKHNYSSSQQIVVDQNSWWSWTNYSTVSTSTTFKFRIIRSGNQFYMRYSTDGGSSWPEVVNFSYDLGSSATPVLMISKESAYPNVYVSFYDFQINSVQAPTYSAQKDSTSNDLIGYAHGDVESVVSAPLGKGLDFKTGGGFMFFGYGESFNLSDITIEAYVNCTGGYTVLEKTNQYKIENIDSVAGSFSDDGSTWNTIDSTISIRNAGWKYITYTHSPNNKGVSTYMLVDIEGFQKRIDASIQTQSTRPLILSNPNSTYSFRGQINEFRISNTIRNISWLEANKLNFEDNLCEVAEYFVAGHTKLIDNFVSRVLKLYRRDTGEYISSVSSDATTGYFYMPTTYSGAHFLVGIDGDLYNHVVAGNINPTPVNFYS